jgi:hypothetical protein
MKKIFIELISILTYAIIVTTPVMAIEDQTGDFAFPDITTLDAKENNGNIEITITCKDAVTGEGSSTVSGTVFLDTDQNYLTGNNGFDYIYSFTVLNIIYSEPIITAILNNDIIDNSLKLNNNKISITIPLKALKKKDGNINLVATVYGQMVGSMEFDRSPDFGVLNIAAGKVDVPFTGISSSAGNIKDSLNQKSSSIDITELNTRIKDGYLYLLITYDRSIDPGKISYGEDILGKIYIDVDQKLATGFRNVGEIPPTFGIDYIIDYSIGRLSGTSANIQKAEKNEEFQKITGISIGPPSNDASFRIENNQLFMTIPTGLLGYDDGNMDIVAESSTIQGIQSADYDNVPDIEKGAMVTKDGTIRSVFACTYPKMTLKDLEDSSGKGYDGDEFTGIDACYSGQTLLLTLSYKSYDLDDGLITTIYFDTNKDKNIIPDYMFTYQIYNGILKGFFSSRKNVVPIEYTQLISMRPGKMYVSIPLELMENDDGNMNIYAETALIVARANIPATDYARHWSSGVYSDEDKTGVGEVHIYPDKSSRTVYDRMPDVGYMEIAKGTNAIRSEIQQGEKSEPQKTILPADSPQNTKEVSGFESILVLIALFFLLRRVRG